MTDARRHPLLIAAILAGVACLALAAVPTASYAGAFAHPARIERLGGAIPAATVRGAEFFRAALAVAGVLIPALAWQLVTMCEFSARPARRTLPGTRTRWMGLLAVCAAGALLRVILASQSLWYDEISAFLSFAIEGPGVAFGSYAVPTNHTPMTLAVWLAWTLTDSTAELVLRAPALIAGIAAIPVAYALAGTLFGRRAAFAGAAVMAVAPIAVIESAEARGYSFVILGAMTAALALARAERTRAAGDYALFAVACAFAAWSHPVAILLPISAGMVGLVRDRRLAVACVLAGVLATVLLSPLAGDVLATRADYARTRAGQPTVFSIEGYEGVLGLALSWSGSLRGMWWLPNIALCLLFAAGLTRILRVKAVAGDISPALLARAGRVILPFALAFALAFALSMAMGTWIYARFLLFALPIGVVVIVVGMRMPRSPAGLLLILLIGAAHGLAGYTSKQPIRDAVELVARARASDDAVATIGLPDNAVGFYAQMHGFEAKPTGFLGEGLGRVIESDHPKFVIVLYPERLDRLTVATLDDGYDRTRRLEGWADWGQGAVEIWQRTR